MKLKVHYDKEVDILYLAREGKEEESIEVYPGVNLELDKKGEVIGVEILNASTVLKEVLDPLREKVT